MAASDPRRRVALRAGRVGLTLWQIGVVYEDDIGGFPARQAGSTSVRTPESRERSVPTSTLDEDAMDRRILVVDDSELVCQQLSQLLASPDRRIKVAHDGTTALEWLGERNFSLVPTDLFLPRVKGVDLRRQIRPPGLP